MKIKLTTKNEEETMLIANKFGKSIFSPCVISLIGDLGAGKTTFAKGFAKGLGISETITSPTFTIMNEYKFGEKNLYHFDLYRLNDIEEFHSLGFEQYFDLTALNGITVVEWASNCEGILPARRFDVELIKKPDSERIIEITPRGVV